MKTTTIQDFFLLGMKRRIPEVLAMPTGIVLNLGAGYNNIAGAVSLDLPNWDADVDDIPYGDGTVDGIHAYHFLEHLQDPMRMLYECQRVLKRGGILNICVPYYTSQIMHHDLTHKHTFCEETWRNTFKNTYYAHYAEGATEFRWKWDVGVNLIIGIVERNVVLLTQLIKNDD